MGRGVWLTYLPNHQRWYVKWKLSWNIYRTHCIHVFARLAPICTLSQCLVTKLLHRSSVGSLLRMHCWLGTLSPHAHVWAWAHYNGEAFRHTHTHKRGGGEKKVLLAQGEEEGVVVSRATTFFKALLSHQARLRSQKKKKLFRNFPPPK